MHHYPQVFEEIRTSVLDNRRVYTLRNCLRAICQHYDVTPEEIKSRVREQRVVVPRHHFCWAVYRNRIDMSYPMIGRFLGKDHTTIVHAVATFEEISRHRQMDVKAVDRLIRSSK